MGILSASPARRTNKMAFANLATGRHTLLGKRALSYLFSRMVEMILGNHQKKWARPQQIHHHRTFYFDRFTGHNPLQVAGKKYRRPI